MRVLLFLLAGIFLSACQSKYDDLSSWEKNFNSWNKLEECMPYTGLTTCTYGGPDWDVKNDTKVKLANGYTLIGRSGVASYTQYLGSDESIAALKTFAESIGADRVYYGVSEKNHLLQVIQQL